MCSSAGYATIPQFHDRQRRSIISLNVSTKIIILTTGREIYTMKKGRVYVLFSNPREETDYHIICCTNNVEKVLTECEGCFLTSDYAYEYGKELTAEIIESKNHIDFGYDDDDIRCVLNTYEVTVPENKEMFAVIANGDEIYSWNANIQGLYSSKDEAVEAIISKISKFDIDEKKLKDYRNELLKSGVLIDFNSTYWNIIGASVS